MKRNKLLILGAAVALAISGCAGVVQMTRINPFREGEFQNLSETFTYESSSGTYLSYSLAQNGGQNAPNTNADIRIYNKNTLTFSANASYSSSIAITSVEITGKNSKSGKTQTVYYDPVGGTLVTSGSNMTWGTGTAAETNTATFTGQNLTSVVFYQGGANNVQISSVTVYFTYTPSSSGSNSSESSSSSSEEISSSSQESSSEIVISSPYTLDGTQTGGTNGYATESDITQNGVEWKVTGNTTESPWRIGGKSITEVDRPIYSQTALPFDVNSIKLSFGSASGITVNSLTIGVYSSAENAADGVNAIATLTATFVAEDEVTVNKPANSSSWSNCFFRIVLNVTVGGSSNKFVAFNSAIFSAEATALVPAESIELDATTLSLYVGGNDTLHASLMPANSTDTVKWCSSNGSVATVNTNGKVTAVGAGDATISAFIDNVDENNQLDDGELFASCSVTVTYAPGTEQNPFTVAQAIAAIDESTTISNAYVRGIISQIDSFNSTYGSITYWISDDGTTTNQLEVYGGLSFNGNKFASISGVELGARVVVKGNLKKYNSIYEFETNSRLVSYQSANGALSSITIGGTYPTEFLIYDRFSSEGIVVTAHYENGATDDVTSRAEFSGYDMSSVGTQSVTVTYREGETEKTATYTITVEMTTLTYYKLYSNDVVEGDYLLFSDGRVMDTTISNNRAQFRDATPSNNEIGTHFDDIVWHIAPSGGYYTIFNNAENKYFASTGAKNQAQLIADGTDDKALWTISCDEGVFTFVNKANAAAEVNSTLRNNGTYGFACYGETTGTAVSLYKMVTPYDYLESSSSIVEINGTANYEGETAVSVSSVSLRFGAKIPEADWLEIQSRWGVADYGVMLIKSTASKDHSSEPTFVQTLLDPNSTNHPLVVNKGTASYADPLVVDGYYTFTIKINIQDSADHTDIYYAAPFICVGETYYFLNERHGSIKDFASSNDGTNLLPNELSLL